MPRRFLSDSGETLTLPNDQSSRIGVGGQGRVYQAQLGGETVAVKLMAAVDPAKLKALQQLEPYCGHVSTLPKHLLYEQKTGQRGELVGYAMRCADLKRSLSGAKLFNFDEIRLLRRYTWQDAVLAALRLAESVAMVHRYGVVIGDLNPENVIFEQQTVSVGGTTTWRATLLDTDSFQLEELSGQRHYCPVSRAPYTAPELIGRDFGTSWRQPSADDFSLAVVIYQLLLLEHPYDNAINMLEQDLDVTAKIKRGLYPHAIDPHPDLRSSDFRPAPSEISESIDQAFRRSFLAGGPTQMLQQRPSASDWVKLLRQLHGQVVPCRSNPQHHHPRGKACLWCALDRRVGQPISHFPNQGQGQTASQKSQAGPIPTSAAAALRPLQERYRSVLQELEDHIRRLQRLSEQKARLHQRVNQLGLAQEQLVLEYGDPKQLIDRQALEGRLWRNFLSHLAGHNEKVNQRKEYLERLINFANDTATGVVTASSRIEQQRLAFTSKLYRILCRVPAQKAGQQAPALVALKALQTKISEKDKQWFSQQLEQEIISNWMIEGLGATRWALLKDHRIINAQQLRKSINDLTTLPGIGTVLQSRLKSQLNTVINQKRLIIARHTWPMRLEDLVNPLEPTEFRQLEEQHIPQIQGELISMEREFADLKQGITIQLAQRDQLIKGFSELF